MQQSRPSKEDSVKKREEIASENFGLNVFNVTIPIAKILHRNDGHRDSSFKTEQDWATSTKEKELLLLSSLRIFFGQKEIEKKHVDDHPKNTKQSVGITA